jgi:hypothetical protein
MPPLKRLGLLAFTASCAIACVATDLSSDQSFCTDGGACVQTTAGQCVDPNTGETRAVVTPGAGDLVISEVMAAPAAASETNGEWFEIYARKDVDLNGLLVRAGSSKAILNATTCLPVAAGDYSLLARNGDAETNGGLPPLTATSPINLPDDASSLSIASGNTLIDQITWTTTKKGVAWQLSPSALDAAAEDRALAFCRAVDSYGDGDKGTPGAQNVECVAGAESAASSTSASGAIDGGVPVDSGTAVESGNRVGADGPTASPSGQCLDPVSGLVRDEVKPGAGDLVVSEIMAAPGVGNNGPGEWFEVLATTDMDLNGLDLASEGSGHTALTSATCLRVSAGDRLLFARSDDPTKNGGLPAVVATFDFTLVDSASSTVPERAVVLRLDGSEISRATWTKSTKGVSHQLAAGETSAESAHWCATPDGLTFGAGDRGTPGAANLDCP